MARHNGDTGACDGLHWTPRISSSCSGSGCFDLYVPQFCFWTYLHFERKYHSVGGRAESTRPSVPGLVPTEGRPGSGGNGEIHPRRVSFVEGCKRYLYNRLLPSFDRAPAGSAYSKSRESRTVYS